MIGNRFYTWFKNYYQWVGGAFSETLLLPLVRATAGLRAGAIRYDQTTNTVETYDGTNWNAIPSASGFVPNSRTITINGTSQDLSANRIYSVGTVTSVGLSAPAAFNVSGSPVTSSGTLALTAAGLASQYVRGDGTLANFPTTTGGGSSVSYYLNGSVNQGTFAGSTFYELSKAAILGAGTNFNISSNGYIASFITDANDPNLLEIPAGNWNFEIYFSASSGGGNPTYYVELAKWDGSGFTTIASNQSTPDSITSGTNKDAYFSALAVPQTTLAPTDRLAVRIYVTPGGRTITLHTENNNLCQVITTFSTGLNSLNGLTDQVQYFATGTAGNDFNIVSSNDTHTFNIPTASATNRGALNSTDWAIFNAKQNALTLTVSGNSGASTLVGATLNVPTYTISGLGGVPTSRQLTINGTAFDLSADRTYNVGTVTSVGLTSATSGVTITSSPVTVSGNIGLAIATASGSQQGLLSSTDWTTFNNKQAALTLTTTGNSGASTLVGATLNVPEYTLSGLGGVPTSRTITINGTTQDLSANRTYNVGTVTSVGLTTSTTGVTIGSTPVTGSGNITIDIATASGSSNGLLSSSDWTTFNNKQNALTLTTSGSSGAATLVGATLNIPQYQAAGNYITALTGEVTASGPGSASATLTNSAVIGKVLTGLNLTGGGTIASTDSILQAFGKIQNQISAMVGGVMFQGTWNASTNTPTLTSGSGTKGHYYIVDVSGTTTLDGKSDWRVGDWAIFNGTAWDKVDNTDAVSSVNGFTGAVSLSTSHINEGTNLYYTDARARAAITLTTTGNSGSATYDASGVLNVPTYTLAGLGGVASTRTLTINGTAFDLSADRSWSVGTVTSVGLSSATSGVTIGNTPVTGSGTITLAIATASGSQQGLLSSTDWTTFNNKQNALTNPITGIGMTGQMPYFTGGTTVQGSNVYWDATNSRMGIGVVSPTVTLDVSGTIASNNGSLGIFTSGASSRLVLQTNGTNRFDATSTETKIGDQSGTETLFVKSGNLGLGVTPSAWFAVHRVMQLGGQFSTTAYAGAFTAQTNDNVINLFNNAFVNSSNVETYYASAEAAKYTIRRNTHEWYIAPSGTAGNAITFTQAMTLDASGNLAIGTTTPTSIGSYRTLTVQGGSTSNGGLIQIQNSDNTCRAYWFTTNNSSILKTVTNHPLILGANNTDHVYITSSGNVGIGTATPNAAGGYSTLSVNGTSGGQVTWQTGGTLIAYAYNTSNGLVVGGTTDKALFFDAGGSERMRITSGGNVGIGTTSPTANLEVYNATQGNIYISSAGTNASALRFFSGGNELVTLRSLGNGNFGIETGTGSPTERMRIYSGGGMRFVPQSAAATAEAGSVYYDSDDNKLKVYNGTSWVDLH